MKSITALKRLTLAEKPNRTRASPIISKRSRLLERHAEQREMASCLFSAKVYSATREKALTDEDGNKKTVTVPKQASKHRKDRDRKLLGVRICDCLDGGTVNDVDYPVLLDAADRLSKDSAMTPKQSGVWSKYANAAI